MGCQQSRTVSPQVPNNDVQLEIRPSSPLEAKIIGRRKQEIFDINDPIIKLIDDRTKDVPQELLVEPLTDLVDYLTGVITLDGRKISLNALQKVRAIFTWIASINIGGLLLDWVPPEDSALSMIWDIKQSMKSKQTGIPRQNGRTNNHAMFFSTMCWVAGIEECMIIEGFTKNSNYFPGSDTIKDTLLSQWNVININGEWRTIDILWASTCIFGRTEGVWTRTFTNNRPTSPSQDTPDIMPNAGNMYHQVNEFYFLTDPDQMIYTHFPKKTNWQLLTPDSCWDDLRYNNAAFLKEMFFHLGMKCLKGKGDKNLLTSDQSGQLIIEFELPEQMSVDMKFKGLLLRQKGDQPDHLDDRNLPISHPDKYIMVEQTKSKLKYVISFPVAGIFKFDIYGNYRGSAELKPEVFAPKRKRKEVKIGQDVEVAFDDDDDDDDDDEVANSKKLFLLTSYRIECPHSKVPCKPLPISSDFGWGDNVRLESWGLSFETEELKSGRISANKRGQVDYKLRSRDSKIVLTYEIWIMKEGVPNKIPSDGSSWVEHPRGGTDIYPINLTVRINDLETELPAEYGLKIFASSDNRDRENICNYLVDWREREVIEELPITPLDESFVDDINSEMAREFDTLKQQLLESVKKTNISKVEVENILDTLSWKFPTEFDDDEDILQARKDFDDFINNEEFFLLKKKLESAIATENEAKIRQILEELREKFPNMANEDNFITREIIFLDIKTNLNTAVNERKIYLLATALAKAEEHDFLIRLGSLYNDAKLLLDTLKHLEELKNSILKLDSATMAEIKGMRTPPHEIHVVMQATLLIVGDAEDVTSDWTTGCKKQLRQMGKQSLQSRITNFDIETFHPEIAARVLEILKPMSQEQVRAVSLGAEAFYAWAIGMIRANQKKHIGIFEPATIARQHEILYGHDDHDRGRRMSHDSSRRASDVHESADKLRRSSIHDIEVHRKKSAIHGASKLHSIEETKNVMSGDLEATSNAHNVSVANLDSSDEENQDSKISHTAEPWNDNDNENSIVRVYQDENVHEAVDQSSSTPSDNRELSVLIDSTPDDDGHTTTPISTEHFGNNNDFSREASEITYASKGKENTGISISNVSDETHKQPERSVEEDEYEDDFSEFTTTNSDHSRDVSQYTRQSSRRLSQFTDDLELE